MRTTIKLRTMCAPAHGVECLFSLPRLEEAGCPERHKGGEVGYRGCIGVVARRLHIDPNHYADESGGKQPSGIMP